VAIFTSCSTELTKYDNWQHALKSWSLALVWEGEWVLRWWSYGRRACIESWLPVAGASNIDAKITCFSEYVHDRLDTMKHFRAAVVHGFRDGKSCFTLEIGASPDDGASHLCHKVPCMWFGSDWVVECSGCCTTWCISIMIATLNGSPPWCWTCINFSMWRGTADALSFSQHLWPLKLVQQHSQLGTHACLCHTQICWGPFMLIWGGWIVLQGWVVSLKTCLSPLSSGTCFDCT
jgi:hypothetical protein